MLGECRRLYTVFQVISIHQLLAMFINNDYKHCCVFFYIYCIFFLIFAKNLLNKSNGHIKDLSPVHIVTLACLIEYISRFDVNIKVDRKTAVGDYLYLTLKFKEYWAGGQDHSHIEDENILNLWRLKEEQKELYGDEEALRKAIESGSSTSLLLQFDSQG